MSQSSNKKTVVIVGGGNGGANATQALSAALDPKKYNLILLNSRPFSLFLIASLRMVVSPADNLEKSAMLPYDKVFVNGNGTFVHDTVTVIDAESRILKLKSGESIKYDALVLATGSSWSGPLAFPDDAEEVTRFIANSRKRFEAADKIVLVGGGAVGIELAGEIKDIWPKKRVTIVHKDKKLLNDAYPNKFRAKAESVLRSRGVDVLLDQSVIDAGDDFGRVDGGQVITTSGKKIPADYIVKTWGGKPNTGFIADSLGPSALSGSGHVKVKPTLQLESHPEIFALGDIIEWNEQKQAGKTPAHAAVVSKNVVSFLSGAPAAAVYKGSPEIIVVTSGKNGGFGYMGFLWGIHVGAWFARMIKSKKLLLPMFEKTLGY